MKNFSNYKYWPWSAKPRTNADRIRAMSDEELAKIIDAFNTYFDACNRDLEDGDCHDCELCEVCGLYRGDALNWLTQTI